ncbi:MAG: hypothetical protein ACJ76P_04905 [Actinomycetota bacterium]
MTQSSWEAIVARIVDRMKTIPDIGLVYDRVRLVTTQDDVDKVFTTISGETRLRAWMVHLETGRSSTWQEAGGSADWNRRAVIEGFLQYEDATSSANTAIGLGESVIRTLNSDLRATKLGGTILGGGPADFVGHPAEPRTFGFVLASYVSISCPLMTIESPA